MRSFPTNTRLGIIGSLLQSGLVLAGAWRWGLSGAVWGMAGAMLVTVWLTRRAVVREWRKFHLCLRWRDAARSGASCWISVCPPSWLAFRLGRPLGCNALLANQPGGYEELGIYNAANQWQQVIQFLPGLMGMALLPILSEKYGQGDRQGSFSVMWKMVKLVAGIVLPLAILVSFLSPWIMRGYGESFVEGIGPVVLSVATAALSAMMTPVGHLISASGRMWIGFWMNAGWGAIMLLASWWMVRWGRKAWPPRA